MSLPEPQPLRERVADYPRPPHLQHTSRVLRVEAFGQVIAETRRGLRVLETWHPPTYYLPVEDVDRGVLERLNARSLCEFKGVANYFDVVLGGRRIVSAAWSYPHPTPAFAPLAGHLAFYPSKLDCFVDGERVRAQEGGFYGGWITADLIGPFKGDGGWNPDAR